MARPRIPAWFYPVAASFLVLFAVLAYSTVYPPAPIGMFFDLRNGELFVKRVVPAMPAERAGLRPGDRASSWTAGR